MVMISVDLPATNLNKALLLEMTPLINGLYVQRVAPGTNRYSRVNRDFSAREAKVMALKIIRAMPEAHVEIRQGPPKDTSLTLLSHADAPKQLGTALRMMKFADPFTVRLVPDRAASSSVRINGKPATPEQVEALDFDWRVAFGHKNTQVTMLLEVAEAEVLGHVVQLKNEPKTRSVGFNAGVFEEIRTVLAEYDLPAEAVIEGWPVQN